MKPRYLITTADEQTWKFDRPVIFLGEWCRLYERKHIWQGMDAVVAAPYGLGQKQKDADYAEVVALEEKIFPILCDALNQIHGTKHGARFWKIVLGHWLRRFVNVTLNRVRTLEHCFLTNQLSGTTVYDGSNYPLAVMDSYSAIWAFNDQKWNNVFYSRIIDYIKLQSFPIEIVDVDGAEGFRFEYSKPSNRLSIRKFLRNMHAFVENASKLFSRETDAVIINSFFPFVEELKLQVLLGQFPRIFVSPKPEFSVKPDLELRRKLSIKLASGVNDTLLFVMCSLLFDLLPVCYLEGFQDLSEITRQLSWPKRPKFIFTSNNFDTDEVFKLWTARKVESGTKYVIGQHGNNYGTYRFNFPAIEETIPDHFLTWGWTDGIKQHTPTFIFKNGGKQAPNNDPTGGLLLIEVHLNHRIETWDETFEFGRYFEDQLLFVNKLRNSIRRDLTVRLHSAYSLLSWDEETRWKVFDPGIMIEKGNAPIRDLVSQNRLVVHSYDSTGLLETLSQNIPSITFWQNDFEHLRDSAIPYYRLLFDAGIIHFNPGSAATKVNEVWNNVEGWWGQKELQKARKVFCDRYARSSKHPARELSGILKGI